MSLTITRNPDTTSSPYLPVYFDCSSNTGTITTVIADIYVNGTLVSTIEKEPLITTTDSFRFEVGEILKKHFTNDIGSVITLSEERQSVGSALYYKARLFEVTDNGTTLDTSWSEDGAGVGYLETSTYYSFDGLMHFDDLLSNYICTGLGKKLLTNRPYLTTADAAFKTSKLLRNQPFSLGFLCEQECYIEYTEFDAALTPTINVTANITPTNKKAFFNHLGDFATNSVAFSVKIFDSSASALSDAHIYLVVNSCETPDIIFWKNQFGAYDYYFFEGNKRKKSKSSYDSFDKRLTYDASIRDRGETVRSVKTNEEYTIYTKTENYRTINWLKEIEQSPEVFIYEANNKGAVNYVPIIITGASDNNTNKDNPVTQLSLTYEYANKKDSQIG